MIITEERVPFLVSSRELSLIKEIADDFLLGCPEASDVEALIERVTEAYNDTASNL